MREASSRTLLSIAAATDTINRCVCECGWRQVFYEADWAQSRCSVCNSTLNECIRFSVYTNVAKKSLCEYHDRTRCYGLTFVCVYSTLRTMDTNVGKTLSSLVDNLPWVVTKLNGLVRFKYTKTNLLLWWTVVLVVDEGYDRAYRFFPGYEVHPCRRLSVSK